MQDIHILSEAKWPPLIKAIEKINSSPKDQYYGERFEIGIASTLVKKKIAFSRPKIRPDFAINYKSSVLKIECTSKHFNAPRDKEEIVMGIKTAIQKKSDIKYPVNKDWCLFIECTNLSFHNTQLLYRQYEETAAYAKRR